MTHTYRTVPLEVEELEKLLNSIDPWLETGGPHLNCVVQVRDLLEKLQACRAEKDALAARLEEANHRDHDHDDAGKCIGRCPDLEAMAKQNLHLETGWNMALDKVHSMEQEIKRARLEGRADGFDAAGAWAARDIAILIGKHTSKCPIEEAVCELCQVIELLPARLRHLAEGLRREMGGEQEIRRVK